MIMMDRLLLSGTAGLACVVAFAAWYHAGVHPTEVPASRPVAERELRIADAPGGAVQIWDADSGKLIETVTGEAGFLRATMRGMALNRLRTHDDETTPFRLTAWADGRLTLDDPLTARHLELEAFGPTNEGVFADLLLRKEGS